MKKVLALVFAVCVLVLVGCDDSNEVRKDTPAGQPPKMGDKTKDVLLPINK